MRTLRALPLALLLTGASSAQQAPPATEIYLAPLTKAGDAFTVGTPVNITKSPGYDNQPFFTPDGRSILFTSARGDSRATDIYRYDIAPRVIERVTDTPESEYSPTITPDGKHISVIRVEADGTQRLWQFTLDGRQPELVLEDVKPVGYHAWIDGSTLALFILGQPPTLQVAATAPATTTTTLVHGIGRSIQRMPDGDISFVRREATDTTSATFTIMRLKRKPDGTFDTSVLVKPPASTEPDMAWTSDGMLLVASGGTLFGWRSGYPGWKPLAELAALGLQGVTRLAVSPKGDYLAIVAQPK